MIPHNSRAIRSCNAITISSSRYRFSIPVNSSKSSVHIRRPGAEIHDLRTIKCIPGSPLSTCSRKISNAIERSSLQPQSPVSPKRSSCIDQESCCTTSGREGALRTLACCRALGAIFVGIRDEPQSHTPHFQKEYVRASNMQM